MVHLHSIYSALLLLLAAYFVAANLSEIPTPDLISHLNNLLENAPLNSQSYFELGLTSQLLADAIETNGMVAEASIMVPLDKDSLRRQAENYYRLCLSEDPSKADALSNLAKLLSDDWNDGEQAAGIISLYEQALTNDPQHFQIYMNLGIFLREIGRHQDAAATFYRGLAHIPDSITLKFELAFTKELLGDNGMAKSIYDEIIAIDPNYTNVLLNRAVLDHKAFLFEDALATYLHALSTVVSYERDCFRQQATLKSDLFAQVSSPFIDNVSENSNTFTCTCPPNDDINTVFKILSNIGAAYRQKGSYIEAIECNEEIIALLRACDTSSSTSKDFLKTSVDLFLSSKAGSFFSAWNWLETLLDHIDTWDLRDGVTPSLLPFDTLGLPVSRGWKKKLAKLYSGNESKQLSLQQHTSEETNTEQLRLGFISHDFSNHPTTYLFEGIAAAHEDNSLIDVAAYSYGPNDESHARMSVEKWLQRDFIDVSSMPHDDATEVICDDKPDIIFDMQGYTLGGRPQLMASRCAAIQVNFLAYPGTSGMNHIDYVIVDRHVAVVERANEEFTEKLALLPRTYQANFFVDPVSIPTRGSDEWKDIREKEGLSTSPSVFVFANLNKHDKLDPASFSAMMQCLSRVPGSVLWLLEPRSAAADIVKRNLRDNANEAGVSPDRVIFAKKINREEHIQRMAAGDLFLDTILYGAHTTATDALRGGLPLLTLAGDSFSSRVGMSLLRNMNNNRATSLITYSVEEFVEVAVEIAKSQVESANSLLPGVRSIATKFIEPDEGQKENELFDWRSYSRELDDMSRMMLEVKQLTNKAMHIVLTNN